MQATVRNGTQLHQVLGPSRQERMEACPEDFFDSTFKSLLVVRHLYVMPKEVGFVIEIRDLRCRSMEIQNPFGDETAAEEAE